MKNSSNRGLKRFGLWTIIWLLLVQCATTRTQLQLSEYQLLSVDESYRQDSLAEATIQPYRQMLQDEMDIIIGHANKRLVEDKVESLLGNFVTDAILFQSARYYSEKVHFSMITNGGLRAPIPEGPVNIGNIYELMPFENLLYILELDGAQTQMLFNKLARDKNVAVSNSVVLIEDDQPVKIYIDGSPYDSKQQYILAVSDYLAQGGGGMEFLKEARVLAIIDVKIRDMIIDHIKELDAKGVAINAEIEGRVKLIP
jgi:2',3'-cyclic-nucleotide 2'-phosphodiesterase (5'-nucleotidase family)